MDLEEPIRVQVTSVKYGKPGQFGESGCGLAWFVVGPNAQLTAVGCGRL